MNFGEAFNYKQTEAKLGENIMTASDERKRLHHTIC